MFNADYEKEVAECARAIWANGTHVLHWSAGPITEQTPWGEGWVDVYVAELCQPLSANWLATIVSPDDDGPDGYGVFHLPHDCALRFEFANKDQVAATRKIFVSPHGEKEIQIEKERQEESFQNQFYWDHYKDPELLVHDAHVPTYCWPVWSVEAVEARVSAWLEEISGCKFTLIFDEQIQSPMEETIRQNIADIKSGAAETFDLGDGLLVHEDALDTLLQNPDEAAELTELIKKKLGDAASKEDA